MFCYCGSTLGLAPDYMATIKQTVNYSRGVTIITSSLHVFILKLHVMVDTQHTQCNANQCSYEG